MTLCTTAPERSEVKQDSLWLVLIDLNCGDTPADWQPDSEPEPLLAATLHAAGLRAKEWIVKVVPA